MSATVAERPVECTPAVLDLLVNAPPERIAIGVPRPELGDLVKALNSATTLYGAELVVVVKAGKQRQQATWREEVYDPETDRARHEVQRRAWRIGRGEETDADRRAEAFQEMEERQLRKIEERRAEEYDY
jgi:hypothetical protein